jgi:Uncharacterised nucleotidyltransferase
MKPETKFSVEQELLLTALGCPRMAGGAATLPALLDQVNWQKLLAATSRDLYPYLCFSLEPCMEGREVPPEWEALHTARRLTAVDNLRLRHELTRITAALTEAGIPALALKGIVVAYAAYKDPSLRPMMDLDLLVPPRERENAIGVLRELEFGHPQGLPIFVQDVFRPGQEFAPPLQSSKSRVKVEIHTMLECCEPLFREPVQAFWSRSTTTALGSLCARTLCPEDNLFHICLHQARTHRFEKGLLPLLDIKVLLESNEHWDWEGIAARALRQGCANWMYLGLDAARRFTGAAVSPAFFCALPEPEDLPNLRFLAEEQILSARSGGMVTPLIPTLLAEPSWHRRAQMIVARTKLVRKEELGPQENSAGFLLLAQVYCRRLLVTMKSRIPKYFRAWRSGALRVGTILKSARLLRHSNTLFALVEQQGKLPKNSPRAGQVAFEKGFNLER